MLSVYLQGGLGNQLFQLFTCIALSIRYKKLCIFPYSEFVNYGRKTYWNNFLKEIKPLTNTRLPQLRRYNESYFHYRAIPNKDNIMLFGYFQSYKYFKNEYEKIIKIIKLREKQDEVFKKYNQYFQNDVISLHFRLGDYLTNAAHPVLNLEYYKKALQHIINKTGKNNYDVLYFCQKSDNYMVLTKIKILKILYPDLNFIKATDDSEDYEQMLMMSCCKHHIIANSSFSWWGAYFNKNDKIVCYPSLWFSGSIAHHNTKDLCPSDWIRI